VLGKAHVHQILPLAHRHDVHHVVHVETKPCPNIPVKGTLSPSLYFSLVDFAHENEGN
jgi:hypothetical protein